LKVGYNAVVIARGVAKVKDLAAAYPDTAVATALDVTDKEHVREVARLAEARFGGIEVLVNNAGYDQGSAAGDARAPRWHRPQRLLDRRPAGRTGIPLRKDDRGAGCVPHRFRGSLAANEGEDIDYVATAGPHRKENDKTHGTQPGDPTRAASRFSISSADHSFPRGFFLAATRSGSWETNDTLRREIDAWKDLSISSDFAADE
jgi:NAD(P)-dependent dehydrogenase (short-subunit alcohol dehydrogenase family)